MAPASTALAVKAPSEGTQPLDSTQTLRASTALVKKIQSDTLTRQTTTSKRDLLADADNEDSSSEAVPLWLILTTKKHIVDQKRLKPGKIALPHPYQDINDPNLRICLITTDPQRNFKDLIAHPNFPLDLSKRISRVIGLKKLKTKYSSFESRRQLYGEHDIFLADDRIITYLPQLLGKIFYKSGTKRPIPVTLEGKRQNFDEQGNKRRKLAEGGTKVVKSDVDSKSIAQEISRALSSALVHLAPSTSTAVKVGTSTMAPEQVQENILAVTQALVEKYVPQQWRNVKAVHVKGPETVALPIWMAEELWVDEGDVREEPVPELKGVKKRKRKALEDADVDEERVEVIEVPGGDGKMRRVEKRVAVKDDGGAGLRVSKKRKSDSLVEENGEVVAKAVERAEKEARKEALRRQKDVARGLANGGGEISKAVTRESSSGKKAERKSRMKAADLI